MRKPALYAIIGFLVMALVFSQLTIRALRQQLALKRPSVTSGQTSAKRNCRGSSNGDHAEGEWNPCLEDDLMSAEEAKIEAHKAELVKLGHMDEDFRMAETVIGHYEWHGNGGGYFGAYSFYEPAFEQAKRGWFLHGEVLEGSNELWTPGRSIHFDQSAIGLKVQRLSMSWFEKGSFRNQWFNAKIVGIKEDGQTAILDKHAPHHAEQWGLQIVPDDWKDMCGCNNFHPPFVDGRPVVE